MDINRRGQALIEMMVGMLLFAFVIALSCAVASGMVKSLRSQNESRLGERSGWRIDGKFDMEDVWEVFW